MIITLHLCCCCRCCCAAWHYACTGAVGFGPITYALPTILYTVAYQNSMPRAKWWFNLAFITFWLLASLAAAVGALYSIVTTASTYHFFS